MVKLTLSEIREQYWYLRHRYYADWDGFTRRERRDIAGQALANVMQEHADAAEGERWLAEQPIACPWSPETSAKLPY